MKVCKNRIAEKGHDQSRTNGSSSVFWRLTLPPASQLLSKSFSDSFSLTNIEIHEQFHTLTVRWRQWGYSDTESYLYTERMETFSWRAEQNSTSLGKALWKYMVVEMKNPSFPNSIVELGCAQTMEQK